MKEVQDKKLNNTRYYNKTAIINKKKVKLGSYRSTDQLLQNLGQTLNTKTMGFFMADDGHHFRSRLDRLSSYCEGKDSDWNWTNDFRKECGKEYSKNKCVHKTNAFGYDNYYLLKGGKALSASDGEFEEKVYDDMSDAQLRTAFKKFSKGKKTNKVLMTSIGKAVA